MPKEEGKHGALLIAGGVDGVEMMNADSTNALDDKNCVKPDGKTANIDIESNVKTVIKKADIKTNLQTDIELNTDVYESEFHDVEMVDATSVNVLQNNLESIRDFRLMRQRSLYHNLHTGQRRRMCTGDDEEKFYKTESILTPADLHSTVEAGYIQNWSDTDDELIAIEIVEGIVVQLAGDGDLITTEIVEGTEDQLADDDAYRDAADSAVADVELQNDADEELLLLVDDEGYEGQD